MKTLTENEDNDLCLSLLFGRPQSHDRYDYVSTVVHMRVPLSRRRCDAASEGRVYTEYLMYCVEA